MLSGMLLARLTLGAWLSRRAFLPAKILFGCVAGSCC
jgi:hypothetical protein